MFAQLSASHDKLPGLRRLLRSSWLIPLLVVIVSLALTGGLVAYLHDREKEEHEAALAREIALITLEVRNRLRSHTQFLRGLRAFFAVRPELPAQDWQTYTGRLNLEAHIPGIEAFGYAPRVRGDDAARFVRSVQRTYQLPGFAIKPPPVPLGAKDDSYLVLHIAPASERAPAAIGLDLFAEPKRRLAIEQARDTDDIAITGRVTLRNDNSQQPQPALLMMLPVYRPGSVLLTVSDRRREIVGVVYCAYRMNDFMSAFNFVRNTSVGLRVFDDEAYNSDRESLGLTLLFDTFDAKADSSTDLQETEIDFGQRKWVLQFQPKSDGGLFSEAYAILAGGLLLSLLLGLLIRNLSVSRRRAEAYAREMNAELHTLVNHIPGGVSLIDSNLRINAVNQRFLEILDLPERLFSAGPPTLYDVLLYNARRGEYGPGNPKMLARDALELARKPVAHVFERTRPDGRTLEIRGAPTPDGGIVTIYSDVTERKLAEAELRRHRDNLADLVAEQTADLLRAKEEAERSNRAKSEFMTNMSHELRTPLHAILSFAALGEGRAGEVEQPRLKHFFSRIHESGHRLLLLINDLLDLAKLEAGKTHVEPRCVDVLTFVHEVGAELEPLLFSRQLQLKIEDAPCSTEALCDPVRFAQVLRNLLGNAIKFSPPAACITVSFGLGTVPAGRRTDDSSVPALSITVSDQGVGIPQPELETIFDKFVQSSKTRTGAGGTGLGLSICREIVLAHHGTIVACNNSCCGASFIVHLPTAPTMAPTIAPRSLTNPEQRDEP